MDGSEQKAMSAAEAFTSFSAVKLLQLAERIEVCLGKLTNEQVWSRENAKTNSVGNLCLHLAGNVRQWILHGIAGQPDTRQRDAEFEATGGHSPAELGLHLKTTIDEAATVIRGLPDQRLTQRVRPQGYDVTVLEAVYHVVEHFAQHTGQIVYITKALLAEDLGFYRHLTGAKAPSTPPPGEEKP